MMKIDIYTCMVRFNFKQFFNETVPIAAFDSIRDRVNSVFQPNTFGIEIEFKYEEEEGDEDFDMDEAWNDFHDSEASNGPEDLDNWDDNNPEPEKPDWDDDDKVVNYYNARMFNDEADGLGEIAGVFQNYTGWVGENNEIKSLMDGFHRFMSGIIRALGEKQYFMGWRSSQWAIPQPENEEKWQENKEKRKKCLHEFWKMISEKDSQTYEKIQSLRENSFKVMELVDRFHDEQIQNLTEEQWEEKVEDFFNDEHEEWQRERDEIESEWDNWRNGGESEAFDNWFSYRSENYRIRGDLKSKMREVQDEMRKIGISANVLSRGRKGGRGWNIFEDESEVIEISSDILTANDFPLVRKFLSLIRNIAGSDALSNDTGAHVHVGTPPYTDAFDLLAAIWLLDEKTILQYAGREDEDIEAYANRKEDFFGKLYKQMFIGSSAKAGVANSITMTNAELWQHLTTEFDRYYGVNAIQAFKKQKTVELRFLSSQIIRDPERFIKFIEYFMTIPQLAQRKKELRITSHDKGTPYRIVRQPGGKVTITDDIGTRVRQANLPVAQLRVPQEPVDPAKHKQDLLAKYGDLVQKNRQQRMQTANQK